MQSCEERCGSVTSHQSGKSHSPKRRMMSCRTGASQRAEAAHDIHAEAGRMASCMEYVRSDASDPTSLCHLSTPPVFVRSCRRATSSRRRNCGADSDSDSEPGATARTAAAPPVFSWPWRTSRGGNGIPSSLAMLKYPVLISVSSRVLMERFTTDTSTL